MGTVSWFIDVICHTGPKPLSFSMYHHEIKKNYVMFNFIYTHLERNDACWSLQFPISFQCLAFDLVVVVAVAVAVAVGFISNRTQQQWYRNKDICGWYQ